MLKSVQNLTNFAPLNCVSLSIRTLLGMLNLYRCSVGTWLLPPRLYLPLVWLPSTWRTCRPRRISIWTHVDSPDCKRPGDIDRPKRISMLHLLLLKELTIIIFLYDFHCVILCCGPIKSMYECFPDDPVPWQMWSAHTLMYIRKQLYAFFSGDALHHHPVGALPL
jgi:hypothetical protein